MTGCTAVEDFDLVSIGCTDEHGAVNRDGESVLG